MQLDLQFWNSGLDLFLHPLEVQQDAVIQACQLAIEIVVIQQVDLSLWKLHPDAACVVIGRIAQIPHHNPADAVDLLTEEVTMLRVH